MLSPLKPNDYQKASIVAALLCVASSVIMITLIIICARIGFARQDAAMREDDAFIKCHHRIIDHAEITAQGSNMVWRCAQ